MLHMVRKIRSVMSKSLDVMKAFFLCKGHG